MLPPFVDAQETQTKPEGQIHFFPVLFDGREVRGAPINNPQTLRAYSSITGMQCPATSWRV